MPQPRPEGVRVHLWFHRPVLTFRLLRVLRACPLRSAIPLGQFGGLAVRPPARNE